MGRIQKKAARSLLGDRVFVIAKSPGVPDTHQSRKDERLGRPLNHLLLFNSGTLDVTLVPEPLDQMIIKSTGRKR